MKFTSILQLEPVDKTKPLIFKKAMYRAHMLHLIKLGMEKVNKEKYEELYESGAVQKEFASSIYLPSASFDRDNKEYVTIKPVKGKYIIEYTWSSYDETLNELFLNTFIYLTTQKDLHFTSTCLVTVKLPKIAHTPKVIGNELIIKTVSPIISLRRFSERQTNKTDVYNAVDSFQQFDYQLKYSLLNELLKQKNLGLTPEQCKEMVEELTIHPIETRKTVQSIYQYVLSGTKGMFYLTGSELLLNYILQSGLGNKRGLGFGLVEMV